MRPARSVCAVVAAGACAAACAADWPQFLGPDRSGVSPETHLARSWPAAGPKVLWTIDVGCGYGAAAVRDGEVFILDRVEGKEDLLRCLDLATGKEQWRFAYRARGRLSFPGSRTVPTVEADCVYTIGPFGDLHCISRKTHEPVWSHNIVRDYSDYRLPRDLRLSAPRWGVTQHPLVYGETVIAAPHAIDAGVVAYDKQTGKLRWRSPDVGENTFSHVSPTLAGLCGVDQVITIANRDHGKDPPAVISGVDAANGKLLWQIDTWSRYNVPIPCPVKIAPDRLFVAGGYTIGCFALKLTPPPATAKPPARWDVRYAFRDNHNCTPHIHTPIFYKGHVYAQSFDKFHNTVNRGLVCLDPDGRLMWQSSGRTDDDDGEAAGPGAPADASRRRLTFDSGGLLIADDLIFVMHGSTGELYLVAADPGQFRILAKAKVLEAKGKNVWAPLALSDGRLIVRDQHQMKCLDVRRP